MSRPLLPAALLGVILLGGCAAPPPLPVVHEVVCPEASPPETGIALPELDSQDIRLDRPILVELIAQVRAFLVDYDAYRKIHGRCRDEVEGDRIHH